MRLKKIVLNGFKSFADKTEFLFDSPITGIVGPNGCGKSNVVDAVKWVLGEQSVKSLRSGQMADVIFSGSSSRKGQGTAEVCLVIENSLGKLPIDADEVQISRRIYKSGECEYRINSKLARLKDIRELLMDTGMGAKAYSIIEQGQVEQLLTASKTERRSIFEEAAGISKYKAHKKEALRKLDRTEQNLLRLADILSEVQKQLRSVKLQAGKARNYLRYKQSLKELQLTYSLVEYHKIISVSQRERSRVKDVEQQFATVAAEVARNDASISTLGNQIIETENQINIADNLLVSVQSKIEQHKQRIGFFQEKISELEQRKEASVEQIESLREQKINFSKELEENVKQQLKCDGLVEEKTAELEKLQEYINKINSEFTSIETELADEKSGIFDIVRRTAQLHNEVRNITVHRDNLSSQKDRLENRANTAAAEFEKLLTDKAQSNARLGDINNVLEDLKLNLEIKIGETAKIAEQLESESRRLAHGKETLSALNSELSILKDMEGKRQGLNNAVKRILGAGDSQGNKFDYVEGILADIISADIEFATAIEGALEGKTDAVVVNDSSRLFEDSELIKGFDGRASFIATDDIEPFCDKTDFSGIKGVKGRAVEFVKYEAKFAELVWKLLGRTIIVESIEDMVRLKDRFGGGYKYVTPAGQTVNVDGVIKLGPLGKSTGLISRKSRLSQLEQTIENEIGGIADTENNIRRYNQTKQHLEKLQSELRTATYEANTEKTQTCSKLSSLEENLDRLSREQPLIASEMKLLEEQIAQSVQKEYESKQKLAELDEVNAQRSAQIEELERDLALKKGKLQKHSELLTELKVHLGQATEQSKSLKYNIENLKNQLRSNRQAQDIARGDIENCTQLSAKSQSDILACESEVSELFVEKEKNQHNSRIFHEKVEELMLEQKQAEQMIREKRNQQSQIDQQVNQLKIELSQLEVKEQGLIERVKDELGIDLAQSYESYQHSDVDWDQLKGQITELKIKIERLGNVNVEAIDQQEELENRNEFLSKQVDDLNKSKAQLQQLIGKLNKKSREKFRETFEEIRLHFQQLFRKLFGGGKADIILEDAEDILESEIEIMARPPGKETRSISLLSGGEKTMTAIALLFSVFKAKPSPFCLLDEVDAALDEANNERFNLLISEFQKDSQFIIITHSKRTMSIADMLYGVTMQTKGVSKKISVRFGEIEDETVAVA